MFDKSQQVNVTYTKVFIMGRFSHWEVDIKTPHSELAATGPSFDSVEPMVADFLFEENKRESWYWDDANDYLIKAALWGSSK